MATFIKKLVLILLPHILFLSFGCRDPHITPKAKLGTLKHVYTTDLEDKMCKKSGRSIVNSFGAAMLKDKRAFQF